MQPRMKLAFTALVIVLVLFVVFAIAPGAALAMRRMLNFIPGFGLVEQGAPIRVLAEPVSQTRDGVIVSIDSAILTADRTVITFSEKNIPDTALSQDVLGGCGFNAKLALPDGTQLELLEGESANGTSRFAYPAITANVESATLVLPCLTSTLPGKAPENWTLQMRFVPAPPALTVVPVEELATATSAPTPIQTIGASPTPGATATATHQAIVIEKALRVDDKLIFIGGFIPPQTPQGVFIQENGGVKITDANGQELPYEIPDEALELPTYTTPNAFAWVAQISSADLVYPLTFSYDVNYISELPSPSTAELVLDVDQLSQSGLVWPVNQSFALAGRNLRLVSVSDHTGMGGSGYAYGFDFESDTDVVTLRVDAPDNPQRPGFGGGGNGLPGTFTVLGNFEQPLKGQVRLVFSHLNVISSSDTFQVQWSPAQ